MASKAISLGHPKSVNKLSLIYKPTNNHYWLCKYHSYFLGVEDRGILVLLICIAFSSSLN